MSERTALAVFALTYAAAVIAYFLLIHFGD